MKTIFLMLVTNENVEQFRPWIGIDKGLKKLDQDYQLKSFGVYYFIK